MRLPGFVRLVIAAVKSWRADEIPRRGAALAFYTLFALGPVLLVATAIAGTVFGEQAARGELVGQIDELIGTQGALVVQAVLARAGPESGSIPATIIGLATFLIAATRAFHELQEGLNKIWRIERKVTKGFKPLKLVRGFLLKRVRSFALVVSIGFLLMVSLVVSAGLSALDKWISPSLPVAPLFWGGLNLILSLGIITLLFASVYRILPDVPLRWGEVFTGAFITALLFTIGKELIGVYMGRSAIASAYGAAGAVVVLLIWVYYSAQVVLFGAEFSRVYIRARSARQAASRGAVSPPGMSKPGRWRRSTHADAPLHRFDQLG